MLLDNRLDLAMIEAPIEHRDLTGEPFSQAMSWCSSSRRITRFCRRTASPSRMWRPAICFCGKGQLRPRLLDTVFEAHDLSVSPLWESASTEALVRAVAAGTGLSILPERLVRRALASGAVLTRPIEGASLVRTCHIVWHRNKYLSPVAQAADRADRQKHREKITKNFSR